MSKKLKKITGELLEYFNTEILWSGKDGLPLMCDINEAFGDKLENDHNCIGCHLYRESIYIEAFLKCAHHLKDDFHFFSLYIMHLYLFTEKIMEVLKIVGLPESYREEKMVIVKEIKLWANFLKHPKAFILTHHPKYVFEGDDQIHEIDKENNTRKKEDKYKIISPAFLEKYYSGEDRNKSMNLASELKHKRNVLIILPDLMRITVEFKKFAQLFVNLIKENKVYAEMLNDVGTLQDYWDKEEYPDLKRL
ncbi:MAG: hypothetical protein IPK88_18020 [Saprospiraceae bacterium]|nr:hypothetical protein [Candidatus Defluviibacterium haderslevense]